MSLSRLFKGVSGVVALSFAMSTAAQAITGGQNCTDPNGVRRHVVKLIGPGGRYCSGTVIGARKVLTAAHCFIHAADAATWSAVMPDSAVGRSIAVTAVRIHPGFNPEALSGTAKINDIAIVKLAEAVPTGMMAAAVGGGALRKGEVTVAGYGGQTLQQVTLTAKDQPLTSNGDAILTAGGFGGGACHGDSGGPVFRKAGHGYVLVGVVSWTQGQCGSMTAVTPISAYRGFVNAGN